MSVCLRLGGLANGFGNLYLILVRLLSAPLGFMKTMLLLPSGLKALATSPSDDIFIAVTARSTSLSKDVKMVLERLLKFGWCRQTFSDSEQSDVRQSERNGLRVDSRILWFL